MNNTPITLIDDHKILLDGVALLLQNNGYEEVKALSDPAEIKTFAQGIVEGIVIIDINIGSINGLVLARQIIGLNDHVSIVMLSSYSDTRLIREAIKIGVKGYLSKQTASSHILAAIRAISNGKEYYDPIIQDIINKSFAHIKPSIATTEERPIWSMLSDREKQVLELIAAEYTSDEIAKELYISKSTVDTYRKNLIDKLRVKNSVGLVNQIRNK